MLERTKQQYDEPRQYDDSIFEGRDEDTDTFKFADQRPAPYQFARSIANVRSDDSMPLFLSNRLDQPEQHDFENPWEGGQTWAPERKRPTVVSRILKMGLLAAAAAAIVAGMFSLDVTHALILNAKASFAGLPSTLLSPSQPSPRQISQSQPDAASRSAATPVQANISARPVSIAAVPPTREEIAAALKNARQESARQVQPEIRAPEPAAAPPAASPAAPVARRLDPDELAALLKRARGLVATGDISAARLLLERAAEAQEAGAALLLAQTYDPAVLGTQDSRSITPDPAMARAWYEKAAQFGSRDAQQRLAQMQN